MGGEGRQVDAEVPEKNNSQSADSRASSRCSQCEHGNLIQDKPCSLDRQDPERFHYAVFPEIFKDEDDEGAGNPDGHDPEHQYHDDSHRDIIQIDQLFQIRHEIDPSFEFG